MKALPRLSNFNTIPAKRKGINHTLTAATYHQEIIFLLWDEEIAKSSGNSKKRLFML
jgi:hypothetical protein